MQLQHLKTGLLVRNIRIMRWSFGQREIIETCGQAVTANPNHTEPEQDYLPSQHNAPLVAQKECPNHHVFRGFAHHASPATMDRLGVGVQKGLQAP